MKKNIIFILIVVTHAFAFGGLGVYGNFDSISATAEETGNGVITVTPGALEGAAGGGFFIYLDAVPIIDLEYSVEIVGNDYPFTISGNTYEDMTFPWVRMSQYFTVRKEIVGASIPFLAKVQLYGGLGFNTHTITPDLTVNFIENAFSDLADPTNQDFSDDQIIADLTDFMNKEKRTVSGFHLQVGTQVKLLIFNLFINGRYTVAKDVVQGTSGYPSMWVGLGYGL